MIVLEKEKNVKAEKNGNGHSGVRRLSTPAIVAITLASVFFVVFMAYHIYMFTKSSEIKTEIAFPDTVRVALDVKMFVVRDEKIINETKGDNIVSAVTDGTRVSVNDTIAYSFADSTSAGNLVRMKEIRELLDYYSELEGEAGHIANDTTLLDEKIMSNLNDFSTMVSSGNLSSLAQEQKEIRDAITSKQTATGVELDLAQVTAQLNEEYAALSASTSSYKEIKSADTGYYIDGTDGCENILNYDDVENWTVEDIEAALESDPQPGDAGRIVHGYYWYLACVTNKDNMAMINERTYRTISFPDSAVGDIEAELIVSEYDEKSDKAVIVFRCLAMNEELAGLRIENAKIVVKEVSGFRINKNAFRSNENNESGVYVINGSKMVFRKIIDIYSDEDYCIAEDVRLREGDDKLDDEQNYISRYDEYIVEGRDLAHGKIVDR